MRNGVDFLCHYTRSATGFQEILPRRALLMNPYSKMRDPFEARVPAFRASSRLGFEDGRFFQFNRLLSEARAPYRLLCMTRADDRDGPASETPFREPWARPRMWEQYGERHEGVCLAFDRVELVNEIERQMAEEPAQDLRHGAVEYTIGGFGTSPARHVHWDEHRAGELDDERRAYVHRHRDAFFMLKTDDWAAEWEYRFVSRSADDVGPDEPRFVHFGSALRLVIVGERFPDWQIAGAREIADDAGAELLRLSWITGSPRLEPPPWRSPS